MRASGFNAEYPDAAVMHDSFEKVVVSSEG
jgi:hypothetical protein